MKKIDLLGLLAIAIVSLFFGVKLMGSLQGDSFNVVVKDLPDFTEFEKRQEAFLAHSVVTEEDGKDLAFSEQTELYVRAEQWQWYPSLEIQSGREYRLKIASSDIQHSFYLEKGAMDQKVDVLIQPGKEYVISLKNLNPGVYAIGCTEYCGIQHNKMRGVLIVR